jgi:hypothetical protein
MIGWLSRKINISRNFRKASSARPEGKKDTVKSPSEGTRKCAVVLGGGMLDSAAMVGREAEVESACRKSS